MVMMTDISIFSNRFTNKFGDREIYRYYNYDMWISWGGYDGKVGSQTFSLRVEDKYDWLNRGKIWHFGDCAKNNASWIGQR